MMRRMLDLLAERGFAWRAGLEVEFHLLRCEGPLADPDHIAMPGPAPKVTPLNHGYQYLTEHRYDALDPLLETLRHHLQALGLPLRSMEVEFGPSQIEVTLGAAAGMDPADMMVLFRSATKQIFARAGYLASFMCRPQSAARGGIRLAPASFDRGRRHRAQHVSACGGAVADRRGSGWAGCCAMPPQRRRSARRRSTATSAISRTAMAPDHVVWAYDNRAAMVRVIGQPGDPATHLENRAGEPGANPYLYMASQIAAGLDGIATDADPGPPADSPYHADAPRLPQSLMESIAALRDSACFRAAFGDAFVDYFVRLKDVRDQPLPVQRHRLGTAGVFRIAMNGSCHPDHHCSSRGVRAGRRLGNFSQSSGKFEAGVQDDGLPAGRTPRTGRVSTNLCEPCASFLNFVRNSTDAGRTDPTRTAVTGTLSEFVAGGSVRARPRRIFSPEPWRASGREPGAGIRPAPSRSPALPGSR